MDTHDEADRGMIKTFKGIRVVDLGRALTGPYCTALLATEHQQTFLSILTHGERLLCSVGIRSDGRGGESH